MGMLVDMSAWPVVYYVYDGPLSAAELKAYLAKQEQLIGRNKKYVVVADFSSGEVPPPAQRAAQADFDKRHADVTAKLCLGVAFVVPGALMRGAITAYTWIVGSVYPMKICATRAEAQAYVNEKLSAAGLSPPG